MRINKGQGVIEILVAVVIIGLVLTGITSLLVFSFGVKNKGMDRKKATELAQLVVERQVALKNNDPTTFWNQTNLLAQTETGYDEFTYDLTFIFDAGRSEVTVRVIITVPGTDHRVQMERYFARI